MGATIENFLRWTRRAPIEERAEAARMLAGACLDAATAADEREEIEAAMTMLLDDSAIEVRIALADALADSEKTPPHVMVALASDRDPVAMIVAQRSPVLLDSELVDMVAIRGPALQVAIASRPFLSRAVSAAIGEVGTSEACHALVANRGARIPRFTLDRIVARHGNAPEVRLALLERSDLPLEVREVLLGRLADALKELIVTHGWATPERAAIVTRDARECATISASFEAPAENIPALVRQLIAAQALTPAFLIRAVVAGQTHLFETALAILSGMPQPRVAALLVSGRPANVRALLQRAKLPRNTFAVFAAVIDIIRSDEGEPGGLSDYRRATRLIDTIVAYYQKRADRELDQILMLLRRFAHDAKRIAARDYAARISEAA
jgi:uncharacterized protein (DUF2336 family)